MNDCWLNLHVSTKQGRGIPQNLTYFVAEPFNPSGDAKRKLLQILFDCFDMLVRRIAFSNGNLTFRLARVQITLSLELTQESTLCAVAFGGNLRKSVFLPCGILCNEIRGKINTFHAVLVDGT